MPRRVKKRSALKILRSKEAQRRLVPAVVISRRKRSQASAEDPALAILATAKRYSARHTKTMHDLMLRSMGLQQTPEAVKNRFLREGLSDIRLDAQAEMLIQNAIRKISEVLIFRMVANELVNDPKLREHLVDLFIDQRFEAMRGNKPPADEPSNSKTPKAPVPADPLAKEMSALRGLLSTLMDT